MEQFNTQTSFKFKIKRFFSAVMPNFVKYGFFSGVVFYLKINLPFLLNQYFDISLEKQKASVLAMQFKKADENFSLLSPVKIGEYISSLTSTAFAQAKIVSLEKSIALLNMILDGILWIVLIFLLISFISTTVSSYLEKEKENELANLVVKKLLPYLKDKAD